MFLFIFFPFELSELDYLASFNSLDAGKEERVQPKT
jgi:hypothetical protein